MNEQELTAHAFEVLARLQKYWSNHRETEGININYHLACRAASIVLSIMGHAEQLSFDYYLRVLEQRLEILEHEG